MPALSDCDRKGKRIKIGHEHQSSPTADGIHWNSGEGFQRQMMGDSAMADGHFLHAAMASNSHHPQSLMPFGE